MQINSLEFFRSKLIKHKITANIRKQLQNGLILIDAFIGKSYINAELVKSGFYQIQEYIKDKYYAQYSQMTQDELLNVIKMQDISNDQKIAAAFRYGELSQQNKLIQEQISAEDFYKQYKQQPLKGYIQHFNSLDNVWCNFLIGNKVVSQNVNLYPLQSEVSIKKDTEKYNQQAEQFALNYLQRTCQNIQLVKLINNKLTAIFTYQDKNQEICLNVETLTRDYYQYRPLFQQFLKAEKSGKKINKVQVEGEDIQIGQQLKVLVVDIQNADNLTVLLNGKQQKIYFSSIIAPKINSFTVEDTAYEMRQQLRQQYYMKYLDLTLDYVRELNNDAQDIVQRQYGTFYYNNQPIMKQFLEQGYVQLMKHKQTDSNRSCEYMNYEQYAENVQAKKSTQLQLVDLNKLQQEQLSIRASQLGTQTVSIEDVQAGGHIKILFKSQLNKIILNQAIVCLVGNKVLSTKRQEFGAQEAQEYLKEQLLFKQVQCEFIGGVERYTNAYYVKIGDINRELLSLGLSYYMPNKMLPLKLSTQYMQAAEQAKMNKVGIYVNLLKYRDLNLDQMSRLKYIENAQIINITNNGKIVFISREIPEQKSQNIDTLIQVNKLVAVKYDNKIVRGQIIKINDEKVDLFLPDYQINVQVQKDKVYQIEQQLQEKEVCTYISSLAFINHDYKFQNEKDKDNFIQELKSIYLEDKSPVVLYCYKDQDGEIQSFIQEKETGEMEPQMTVNCYLVENGFVGMSECEGPEDIVQQFAEFQQNAVTSRVGIHQ